jgi:hypothetical protein
MGGAGKMSSILALAPLHPLSYILLAAFGFRLFHWSNLNNPTFPQRATTVVFSIFVFVIVKNFSNFSAESTVSLIFFCLSYTFCIFVWFLNAVLRFLLGVYYHQQIMLDVFLVCMLNFHFSFSVVSDQIHSQFTASLAVLKVTV